MVNTIDISNEFLDLVGDVRPLPKDERVAFKKKILDASTAAARRRGAVQFTSSPGDDLRNDDAGANELSDDRMAIKPLAPLDVMSFQRPGVQHSVFRKLRSGKYPIEASLDLHQMTIKQARTAIVRFVRHCCSENIRYVLINHGKGEGRPQPAVLKSCVAQWLPQLAEVLAFHSAQQYQGGMGATCVILKKSDSNKKT